MIYFGTNFQQELDVFRTRTIGHRTIARDQADRARGSNTANWHPRDLPGRRDSAIGW